MSEADLKNNPQAIPTYLEKYFKQKESMKKERQMMGNDSEELLKNKIQKMEEEGEKLR